jgi:perosamine synthetase
VCPVAEDVCGRLLTLPMFPAMSDADVDDVVTALAKVLGHYAR